MNKNKRTSFKPEEIMTVIESKNGSIKLGLTDINGTCIKFQEQLAEAFPEAIWWVFVDRTNRVRGMYPKQPENQYGIYVGYMLHGMTAAETYFWRLNVNWDTLKKTGVEKPPLLPPPLPQETDEESFEAYIKRIQDMLKKRK